MLKYKTYYVREKLIPVREKWKGTGASKNKFPGDFWSK